MKALILAPHADDEVIGCGGTIYRIAREGGEVVVYIATKPCEPRWSKEAIAQNRRETVAAAEALGVKKIIRGNIPTMHLAGLSTIEIATPVADIIKAEAPDTVIAPPPLDLNTDHGALYKAALVACRFLRNCPVTALYCYETCTTSLFCGPESAFRANTYVDITGAPMRAKIAAMKAYKSEVREHPHPRSIVGLHNFAQERGLGCGYDYAEGFMLVHRRVGKDGML